MSKKRKGREGVRKFLGKCKREATGLFCALLCMSLVVGCTEASAANTVLTSSMVSAMDNDVTIAQTQAPCVYQLNYPLTGNAKIDKAIETVVKEKQAVFGSKYTPTEGKSKDTYTLTITYESFQYDENKICIVLHETHDLPYYIYPIGQSTVFLFDVTTGEPVTQEEYVAEGFYEAVSAYMIDAFTNTEAYEDKLFGNYKEILAPESETLRTFAITEEGLVFYFAPYSILPGSMGAVEIKMTFEDLRGRLEQIGLPANKQDYLVPDRVIDPAKPMVALTFDDGPHPVNTEAILDTLEKYHVVATFFDLGNLVAKYPKTAQRELSTGCEVASHSYSHLNFTKISTQAIGQDITKTKDVFMNVLGQEPTLFRPPYGAYDEKLLKQLPASLILWSVDTLDWQSRDPDAIMEMVRREKDLDGQVILMHGIYDTSAEATERLVPYLLNNGYQLVTVSELLEYRYDVAPEMVAVFSYGSFK